jgi:hypothetical protein
MGDDYTDKRVLRNSSYSPFSPRDNIFDSNEQIFEFAEDVHTEVEDVMEDYEPDMMQLTGRVKTKEKHEAESREDAEAFDRLGYEPMSAEFTIAAGDTTLEPEEGWNLLYPGTTEVWVAIKYVEPSVIGSEFLRATIGANDNYDPALAADIKEGVDEIFDELE